LTGKYDNVFGDTSSWLGTVGKPGGRTLDEAADLFRRIGTDRVLFGSNYPITDIAEFVTILRDLPLTPAEKRQVFFENAMRLYPGLGSISA
jgi:predicted TIM-barrel fold metal-dependent hydrolase